MKRLFDLFVVLVALILLSPIFIIAFFIIFIADGFPVFYIQQRVGLNGKMFNLYKFRSMKKNSDKLGSTTFKNDDRIFLGGRFLRKYKIDELAQLLNVLMGEMSIVGPRPTVMEDFNKMTTAQKKRNIAVPGLTGLAQISGNTSLKWPERIKLDLEYIEKQSFLFDLQIIFKTFLMLLSDRIDSETNDEGEW
jgi:undecaprenyl phosphate N,N'-diacetylbacillosamine 1-phosphate transferase